MREHQPERTGSNKASNILGLEKFTAISAVEGLKLSRQGRQRVTAAVSIDKRRASVIKAYLDLKDRRSSYSL